MKLAFTGKGGVGKTTIVALLARVLKDRGKKVLLIDADPDMNLATVLGIPSDIQITPIVELKELIAERTGVEVGTPAPFFKLNPKVDDIPDRYCIDFEDMKLIVMGTVKKGGGGCACPENAFLKSLLSHLVIARDEWVLLDMEAGIEHLGRSTALGVNHMVIIVEPTKTSIETAHRIKKLSADIGIRSLHVIANKIQFPQEVTFLKNELGDFNILEYIDYTEDIKKISMNIVTPMEIESKSLVKFENIVKELIEIPVSGS
jgi:CO dehydrogenase maturation factor